MPPRRPPLRDLPPPPTRGVRPAAPPVSRAASAIVAGLAKKTRYVDPALVAQWPALAGAELAALCRPGRLTGGRIGRTLEVVAANGAAAARVSFEAEALRRRLNAYFGPNAIGRVQVVQAGGKSAKPGPGGGLGSALERFRASIEARKPDETP